MFGTVREQGEDAMYVVAIHRISDPGKFLSTAQTTELPAGLTLHSLLPSQDGSQAVCLWEGSSVEDVRALVEGPVGEISRNEYFQVEDAKAVGLPQ
jgi:hypothetical protein